MIFVLQLAAGIVLGGLLLQHSARWLPVVRAIPALAWGLARIIWTYGRLLLVIGACIGWFGPKWQIIGGFVVAGFLLMRLLIHVEHTGAVNRGRLS